MNGNRWFSFAFAIALAGACASTSNEDDERVGGETHWLGGCRSDADCDRGTCLCGVCTVACTDATTCGDTRDSACVATSQLLDGRCVTNVVSVCLAACAEDGDCPSGTRCTSGSCVSTAPVDEPPDSGAGGSASGAGGSTGGSGDAGGGGGATGGAPPGGSGGTAPDACGSKTAPPPPASATSDANVGDVVTALYSVDFGDRDPNLDPPPNAYLSLGWDLDGVCTTRDNIEDGECTLPDFAGGSIDGPGGIDNTFGAIVQRLRQTLPGFSSESASAALQAGATGFALRVRGYNGTPDDQQVEVALFARAPFEVSNGAGSTPAWDGGDTWPIASDSVTDPTLPAPLEAPAQVDPRAYVTGGRLVATFPQLSIPWHLPTGGTALRLQMELSMGLLACDIELSDQLQGTFTNCTLAGRWVTDHLLHQLSQLSDPTSVDGTAPLCTDDPIYGTLKTQICSRTDVVGFFGGNGRAQPCDALSVGIGFETRPALLGDLFILDEVLPRCPDATEPSNDSCASP